MRLIDFQIFVRPIGLAANEQKAFNEGMFPVYEAVRLWLKEQKVTAPFKKIVVSLADRKVSEQWHGKPTVALGICEITEAVTIEDLVNFRGDHKWTCARVIDALGHISSALGWSCEDLVSIVREVASRTPPCSHRFTGLRKWDKSGLACDVVLEADVGKTVVKVQFSVEETTVGEVVVASQQGPLFMEDDYPVVATKVEQGHFVLIGKDKAVLGQVAIPNVASVVGDRR